MMRRRILSLTPVLMFAASASACSRDSHRVTDSAASVQPGQPASASAAWVVTPRGIGPIAAGMQLAQANAALGRALGVKNGADTAACGYVSIPNGPRGVSIMLEHGIVARVDVDRGTIVTSEGARVGDTEARIEALYPGRVTVAPHKYTNGHYLTVRPSAAADSMFRIVFETDGRVVTQDRAGRIPAVSYVERCG